MYLYTSKLVCMCLPMEENERYREIKISNIDIPTRQYGKKRSVEGKKAHKITQRGIQIDVYIT